MKTLKKVAFAQLLIVVALAGCQPDIMIANLQVQRSSSASDPWNIHYQFDVKNRDYGGSFLARPTAATGKIVAQARLSSDGVKKDGTAAGWLEVLPASEAIPVGGQKSVSSGCNITLDSAHPYLIVTVRSLGQLDYDKGNNSMSKLIP